ncbi:glycosyltransferase family 2 protein [Mesorhizobium xinjiangense]|uniref:glycosyltransferase family 2 protein n=1 Tax=Mesorhizobium xinjiangense TaxID=2678685 RepID=UPI0012EE141E|nr:glycosyltransferase family 2 protein [Mesorhizobium xinjiangense]
MRLAVIIPTLGRSAQVRRLLAHLEGQSRLPDAVILSAPDAAHVDQPAATAFPVSAVFGRKGLCAQRNTALAQALDRFDIVTFFDDDFVPSDDYLERVERAFALNDDFAVVMGHVVKDGACNAGLDWAEALEALEACATGPQTPRVVDHVGAYGCNMSIRSRLVGDLRFDERLVLYGWQEDIDFTSQLRARGRVVCLTDLRGVHLGVKSGRVSGRRFGYSQVVNPLYLIRKGSVPASFALPLLGRNLAANVVRSLRPEPFVDRRGRLSGNLLALAHVLTGRIEPEYILKI